MSQRAPEDEANQLSEREYDLLRALIHAHVQDGEPVGSTRLSNYSELRLSSASIRNVMAGLEERGFLLQPHTSAGRVPTDRAYRLYVDKMLQPAELRPAHVERIEDLLEKHQGGVPELLKHAARELSALSQHVGVVLAPRLSQITIERIDFIRLDPGRIIAILVGRSGFVHHRLLQVEAAPEQAVLDRAARWLSDTFGQRRLEEMRREVLKHNDSERLALEETQRHGVDLCRRAIDLERAEEGVALFVDGTANLIDRPEFADREALKALVELLNERERLAELLNQLVAETGVQVWIGDENPVTPLQSCSVVAMSYGANGRRLGSLGLVGPTRMEYGSAVSLVTHLALAITRHLSSLEDPC